MGRGWDIERWIAVKEADRLEPEGDRVHGHDRPLLGPGDVVNPEDVPEHDVGVVDYAVLGCPGRQPAILAALDDELAARPALVLVKRCNPKGVGEHLGRRSTGESASSIAGKQSPGTSL